MFDVEQHLQEMVQLHFEDGRGAPYWIEKKSELSFDPVAEIEGPSDLHLFADDDAYGSFPTELLQTAPRQLIPQQYDASDYGLFSSGGRTGTPKWTAWVADGMQARVDETWRDMLRANGVPEGRDLFYIGPTGPHVFGNGMRNLANNRGGSLVTIDLDPRWIRTAKTDRELQMTDTADRYLQHLRSQVQDVIAQHGDHIGMVVSTPTIIGDLYRDGLLDELDLDAVVFSGQAIAPENYRLLSRELDAFFSGVYGNTLTGVQPQVDYNEDHDAVVYQPQDKYVIVEVVEPGGDGEYETVSYGETGRTLTHVIREGLFAPYLLEDDAAIRLPSQSGNVSACLGNPDVPESEQDDIESGVY
ncbi:hypothetical protein [Haloarcula salinisoli]|uniref:Phenazine biosynthesis protein n=1 Tax=Haloarcula salinisoli TaxID=2487746 RepID=A0A8J7YI75_9EURY|nr:hypothetical protein [Halomicroarcula salinisoli]MBX0288598.1 hypothetical protein [Halomicroarcula salinisoli]MBX0306022.1 hypothetical protein [Halomicroarcula salinisoli]